MREGGLVKRANFSVYVTEEGHEENTELINSLVDGF